MKFNEKINKLSKLLIKQFPPIKQIIAYGSAAIPQKENTGNMIDLLFIVKDIKSFHKENLKINKYHYSFLSRMLGANLISYFNDKGTFVYYNPSVKLDDDTLIKYGVISENKAILNIKTWNNLFFCGRMHKPVKIV